VPPVSEELFLEACHLAYATWEWARLISSVAKNAEFVPPYGLGASMYLRPLLLGTGPELGLSPPKEFTFLVYVTPGIPPSIMNKLNRSWELLPGRHQTGGRCNIGRLRSRLPSSSFFR
jgi:hypothetical protein